MKKLIFILLIVLFIIQISATTFNEDDYFPNVIIVGFEANAIKTTTGDIHVIKNNKGQVQIGHAIFDSLAIEYDFIDIERMFYVEDQEWCDETGIYPMNIFRVTIKDIEDMDAALESLLNVKEFLIAEFEVIIRDSVTPNDPQYAYQWHLNKIQAPLLWDFITDASEIIIAIIDGGVKWNHADLKDNIYIDHSKMDGMEINWTTGEINRVSGTPQTYPGGYVDDVMGWDFYSNGNNPYQAYSGTDGKNDHGAHVAGIAGAVGNNLIGISGVPWNVKLLITKHKRHNAYTRYLSNTYDGIIYAADRGAHIINCSWGGASSSIEYANTIINYATHRGSLVVTAAGNNNRNLNNYLYEPACAINSITVGATESDDTKASYSNYGVAVDVMAPGTSIYSTSYNGSGASATDSYVSMDGTSMAAPVVSGLAAMIRAIDPTIPPLTVKQILKSSCEQIAQNQPGETYAGLLGAGRINGYNAILRVFQNQGLTISAPLTIENQSITLNGIWVIENNVTVTLANTHLIVGEGQKLVVRNGNLILVDGSSVTVLGNGRIEVINNSSIDISNSNIFTSPTSQIIIEGTNNGHPVATFASSLPRGFENLKLHINSRARVSFINMAVDFYDSVITINGNDALLEFVGESESYVSFMSTNVSIVNSGHLSANIIEQLYLENSSINMANNSKFTAEESQIILSDDSAIAMNRSSFTIDNHSSMTLQYESSLSLLNHSNVEIKGYSHLNLLSDSTIKGESEKISEDLLGSRIILNKSEADFEAGTTITGIDGSRWTGITFIDCASSNEFPFTSHIRSSIISDISSLNVSTSTVKFNDIIIENIGKFNAVRSNILIDNMIYRDNDHPISALQGTLNIDNSTIHNNASHGVYLFDIAVVKEVKEHSVPSTRIIPYQVEVDTLRYVSQLRNSEVYSNQGIGVFVSTGSIFLKNTKVYGNGKDLSYVDDVYDGAGFYSTSLTRSTLSIGSIIRGNKNYDIYCRANKWPSFGLSANGSSGFSYVGCGNTNPAVFLFPQQHYFYAFGDFTPPIASYNVNVPTSDSDLFYPSLSSFDLGYPTNPAVMNAYTQYIEALEAMYEGEYERAYDELQDFIEENADVVSLNSEVLSALTLLPYLASAIEGRTEYLNEFIAGLEEEVFGIHLGYATLTSKVLDEDYVEAMQVINDLLEDIDDPDDIDSILLELEAAHLYLILVLENVRSIPSATYQPTTYEEFYAIQEDLERKIMRLNAKNDTEPPVPAVTKLTVSNYPNPFNPETVIAYAIPRDSNVKIDVYNIKGQRVKRLVNELHTSGHHSVVWTGFDDAGNSVSSGLYFYRVQTDDSVVTKKMILMK